MVDRFHDDQKTAPDLKPARRRESRRYTFYGGKIKGVENNLTIIAGLDGTAIWLSAGFEKQSGCVSTAITSITTSNIDQT